MPLFGALAEIDEKGPEFPDTQYSSFTFAIELLAVQVIGWVDPCAHLSPPFGDVTLIEAAAGAVNVMAKTPAVAVPT